MPKIDILKFILQHQQGEKDRRREREYRIFTWSSSLLFVLIGALLITKQNEIILWEPYGSPGNYIASIAVILLVIYSIAWQIKHNKSRAQNSEVISRIEEFLHCFDEGYFRRGGRHFSRQNGEDQKPRNLAFYVEYGV
jgi:cytochrome bd-type quinol oxidase subunit 2